MTKGKALEVYGLGTESSLGSDKKQEISVWNKSSMSHHIDKIYSY